MFNEVVGLGGNGMEESYLFSKDLSADQGTLQI